MTGTTGDSTLDFVLDAGPRTFTPVVPAYVRETIAKSSSLDWYRNALLGMSQNQVAQMHAEIRQIGRENRRTERKAIKAGFGLPYARIPLSVIEYFKQLYGEECWQDQAFMEDFLKHHPECKFRVTRNERGNEWRK